MRSIYSRDAAERQNLLFSLGTSLGFHAVIFGSWLLLGSLLISLNRAALEGLQQEEREERRRAQAGPPTLFIEVTPEQASAEAPPNETPFYSAANARAANPEPSNESDTPKIDGEQERVVKTFDTLQPQPELTQPPPPEPLPEPEPAPTEPPQPGDLSVGTPEPPRQRPRTLEEARIRKGLIASPRMKQAGGVRRRGTISFDVKATPFGAYDAAFIAAVQHRWYDLLEDSAMAPKSGKVVVEFVMHRDGEISDIRIAEQDVGEVFALYCRKAINDPAPYAQWPSDMHRMIGKDYRQVRFTFHYL